MATVTMVATMMTSMVTAVTTVTAAVTTISMAADTVTMGKTIAPNAEVEVTESLRLRNRGEYRLTVPVVSDETNVVAGTGLIRLSNNKCVLSRSLAGCCHH